MEATVKINREVRLNFRKYEYFWNVTPENDVKIICKDCVCKEVVLNTNGMPFRTLTAAKDFCERNGFCFTYKK